MTIAVEEAASERSTLNMTFSLSKVVAPTRPDLHGLVSLEWKIALPKGIVRFMASPFLSYMPIANAAQQNACCENSRVILSRLLLAEARPILV
jgi:hypothetical protein